MSDRELLELAAKAAGKPISGGVLQSDENRHGNLWWVYLDDPSGKRGGPFTEYWNPLLKGDDDDCFALMIKLRISVEYRKDAIYGLYVEAVPRSIKIPGGIIEWEDKHESLEAATRRAIVRAAAEIGKSMP